MTFRLWRCFIVDAWCCCDYLFLFYFCSDDLFVVFLLLSLLLLWLFVFFSHFFGDDLFVIFVVMICLLLQVEAAKASALLHSSGQFPSVSHPDICFLTFLFGIRKIFRRLFADMIFVTSTTSSACVYWFQLWVKFLIVNKFLHIVF